MPRSFSIYKDREKTAEKITPDSSFAGSLASLHALAWGSNDPDRCFRHLQVKRDEEVPVEDVEIPERTFVLDWKEAPESGEYTSSEGPRFLREFGVTSALVRREYLDIMQEIIDTSMSVLPNDRTTVMDVDDHEGIRNPFTAPQLTPRVRAAIITGSPGTGKSLFLAYLLALRVLAGKTTIFQSTNTSFYVLNPEGVFQVPFPIEREDLSLYIERGTWFLFDSNRTLKEPPEYFTILRRWFSCFIIQAASPCKDRLQWAMKLSNVPRFWMAPWSLGELIAARDLQIWEAIERPTERQMKSFCELYGTLARTVFDIAASSENYEPTVSAAIDKLNRHNVFRLLRDATSSATDGSFSHLLIVAMPNPGNHRSCSIDIASKALTERLLDHFRVTDKEAALHMYWLFLTNSCTRNCARYFLEKAFLEQFPKGGKWPVTLMEIHHSTVNAHWKLNPSAGTQYLLLGYKDEPAKIIADLPFPRPEEDEFSLKYHEFPPTGSLQLEGGFFKPEATDQAMFNSFIYDASTQVATLFQVTVTKSHELVTSGLKRLKDARAIDLVVVTCPRNYEGAEDVYMRDADYDELCNGNKGLRHVYLLELGAYP